MEDRGMKNNQIYHCSLTVHLIRKNHNSQKILGDRTIHIPVNGRLRTKYRIDYQTYRPDHFHLSMDSPNYITGRIEAYQGRPFLSNNNQTFTYEADAGLVNVSYFNQNHQRVGNGTIYGDFGQRIDVIQTVSLPRGYHYVSGHRIVFINQAVQSVVINVRGQLIQPHQAAFTIVQKRIKNDGTLLGKNKRLIYIPGRIGDNFVLNSASYCPLHFEVSPKNHDVNGIITWEGIHPKRSVFTYVKKQPPLFHYPLTIKIIKQIHNQVKLHTVVKTVKGELYHHYRYSYRDFIPRGFKLSHDSASVISGQITAHGLSHPNGLFVFKKIKVTEVQYVNQHGSRVGSNEIRDLGSRKFQQIIDQLHLPRGYCYSGNGRLKLNTDKHAIIQVQGNHANHQQRTVHLTIMKKDAQQHPLKKFIKLVQVPGRIGDSFRIDPKSQVPRGYRNDIHNQVIRGTITYHGPRWHHQVWNYFRIPHRGTLRIEFMDQDQKLIQRITLHKNVGQKVNLRRLKLPSHFVLRPRPSWLVTVRPRPQLIHLFGTVRQPQKAVSSKSSSSAAQAKQSESAGSISQSSRSSSASSASQSEMTNYASSSANRADHSKSAQHSRKSLHNSHVSLVRKAFLRRCYSRIFRTNMTNKLMNSKHRQQYRCGIVLADSYIQGVNDARRGLPESHKLKSYRYGYQSFRRVVKGSRSKKRMTLTEALLIIVKNLYRIQKE